VGCASNGNVVTQHNDSNRTGVYPYETALNPSQVLAHGMKVKYTFPVANQSSINGQPLYVHRVPFSKGAADGLFITDTRNNVYAVDADTGSQKWHVTLADSDPHVRGNPTAIDTTPVIDVTTHRIYVVFSTNNNNPLWDVAANEAALAARLDSSFWLVALDYTNGNEVARTRITASLYRNNGVPFSFDARFQRNHASLLMDHGIVYVAFGSVAPAEWTEFHGWVMAYRATDLGFVGAWCASKNFMGTNPYDSSTYLTQGGSGIWEGGGGLSSDADGNVYFLTGNGEADVANDKYGDSFVKLKPTAGGLIAQAFIPSDAQRMFAGDADAGAGGTLTIPGTNLVIGGGKTGYMFLLDRSTMQAVQRTITASTSQYSDDNADSWRYESWYTGPHLHGSPTYWRGPDARYGYLYVWGEKDYLRQYRFDTTTGKILEPAFHRGTVLASDSPPPGNSVVMPGGIASLSSNNNAAGSGILWSTLPHNDSPGSGTPSISAHLYAFNAETLQHLWDVRFPSLGHWLPLPLRTARSSSAPGPTC
jgi:outer membrane protein assembly factor BamB